MFMYRAPVWVFVYGPWLFYACAVRQVIIAFRFSLHLLILPFFMFQDIADFEQADNETLFLDRNH